MKTLGLVILFAWMGFAAAAKPAMTIDLQMERGELEIRFKDKRLLLYAFATNQFKPYVRELYTLRGENVLRDAPPDHQHHHGLMYAVCVNGINFWEEKDAPGTEKLINVLSCKTRLTPQAEFVQIIHWLDPKDRAAADSEKAALLLEQRTIRVTVDEKKQEVALAWDSEFQAGKRARKVTLHGPNYDGLGLRLPESFNRVAKFQNAAAQPYAGANTQNVIPAQWTGVSGVMDGRDVMVVLFGHSKNACGDATFFTMLEPFAYLSATQALDKKPLEYSAGQKFRLTYLLTVYPENKSTDFIQQRYQIWEKNQN